MKRREFLKNSIVGIGSLFLGNKFLTAENVKTNYYNPFELIPLGNTKLMASRVGLGTGMNGSQRQSNQTRLGKQDFERLLRTSYELGVRLFDMADLYGSHQYVVSALKGIPRENYVLVSKIWFRRGGIPEPERPDADVVVNRFLKEIGTDYIDIVQMHCMVKADWHEEMKKQMDILSELKQKGLIRAHGVSCHSLPALEQAAVNPWVDVVHTRINAYGDHMDDTPEIVVPVLEKMHQSGKGIIGMKLVGAGNFRHDPAKRMESAKFVLKTGVVDCMIVGFESIAELDDFTTMVAKIEKA